MSERREEMVSQNGGIWRPMNGAMVYQPFCRSETSLYSATGAGALANQASQTGAA